MKRQDYFPLRIGDQIVWLRNFKTKLPLHATALALVPADVTAILLDVDNAIYGLETYRAALGPASTSCYQCIEDALYGDSVPGNVMWMGFAAPAGAPTAVLNGCLKRVFAYIADKIKTAAAYSTMVGEDLGTEGTAAAAPNPRHHRPRLRPPPHQRRQARGALDQEGVRRCEARVRPRCRRTAHGHRPAPRLHTELAARPRPERRH